MKRWIPLALLIALSFGVTGCFSAEEATQSSEFGGPVFGSTYRVKLAAPYPKLADLKVRVEGRLAEIDQLLSTYKPDSELSRWNRDGGTKFRKISRELFDNLEIATEVSRRTGGAYDVTVGPLVNLWGFGPEARPETVPSEQAITKAKRRTGFDRLAFKRQGKEFWANKLSAEISVDLSSVAKGYAVDEIAALLDRAKTPGYMVEIGGEVRVRGPAPEGQKGWRLGIERPLPGARQLYRVVELKSGSLATSGTYRNFFVRNGQRFSHTIDPRTGRPIRHRLVSVSVVMGDCAAADAWATAFMVTGAEEGMKLAQKYGIAALFLSAPEGAEELSPDTQLVEQSSPKFEKMVLDQ
jgi:thiamine biosynthesis lipoprotein